MPAKTYMVEISTKEKLHNWIQLAYPSKVGAHTIERYRQFMRGLGLTKLTVNCRNGVHRRCEILTVYWEPDQAYPIFFDSGDPIAMWCKQQLADQTCAGSDTPDPNDPGMTFNILP